MLKFLQELPNLMTEVSFKIKSLTNFFISLAPKNIGPGSYIDKKASLQNAGKGNSVTIASNA